MIAATWGTTRFWFRQTESKEGWDESDKGDDDRNIVVKILRSYEYEDGSNPLHWVEVQYHDDNGDDG